MVYEHHSKLAVWKYKIPADDEFVLKIPSPGRILHVDVQNGEPYLWALVNPIWKDMGEKRTFMVKGTGHEIDVPTGKHVVYHGTFLIENGKYVFHIFEMESEVRVVMD